jgi:hypothetical protein
VVSAVVAIASYGAAPIAADSLWEARDTSHASAAHPYAIAHYLLAGRFPPSTSQSHEFVAERDQNGNRFHADCVYEISGKPDSANWWSLAAGSGIATTPTSSTIAAGEPVLNIDRTLTVVVSRDPRPGNWIRPAAPGVFEMIYTVASFVPAGRSSSLPPFSIKKVQC